MSDHRTASVHRYTNVRAALKAAGIETQVHDPTAQDLLRAMAHTYFVRVDPSAGPVRYRASATAWSPNNTSVHSILEAYLLLSRLDPVSYELVHGSVLFLVIDGTVYLEPRADGTPSTNYFRVS